MLNTIHSSKAAEAQNALIRKEGLKINYLRTENKLLRSCKKNCRWYPNVAAEEIQRANNSEINHNSLKYTMCCSGWKVELDTQ